MCAVVSIGLIAFSPAKAKVAPATLKDLTASASVVVVGTVTRVLEVSGVRVAILLVSEHWKGESAEELMFLAQPTWTCDGSWAEQGEQGVYFLAPYKSQPDLTDAFAEPVGFREELEQIGVRSSLMVIAWYGVGRLLVDYTEGQESVVPAGVELPAGLPTIAIPGRETSRFEWRSDLASFRTAVRRLVGTQQ
jgi:hypothetical protein